MLLQRCRASRLCHLPAWLQLALLRRPRSCITEDQSSPPTSLLSVEPGVQRALEQGLPVVALESTIISHGMPYPENLAMARGVEDIIRDRGAVPATVAIVAGRPHVGLTSEQLESLAKAGPRARKCSRRDIAVAIAQGIDGATTVASTSYLASLAGVKVFVTGGMGGVHRGAETTFDVSADLMELAQTPIVVVCAGIKSILDVEKTLEILETQGVPVISYGTDDFPAFFSPSSGVPSPLRLDTPSEVAAAAKAGFDLGMRNGVVVAVPNPSPMDGGADVDAAIRLALVEANEKGLIGRDVTPFVLASVNDITGGQSLKSNVALVRHNARVGADIAVELSVLESRPPLSPLAKPGAYLGVPATPPNIPTPSPSPSAPEARHRPARVAVFGGAVADIVSKPYPGSALTPGTSTPGETRQSFGGVARNIAEGLARVLLARRGGRVAAGDCDDGSDCSADVTLVAAVGADDAGRALVTHCEEVGVKAQATVEVNPRAGRGSNHGGGESAGTASYVAMLGGDGELVAAVANMRVLERMTAEFVERNASVIDGATVVIADGNLPPEGFAQVARLCSRGNVPLVFEPTSVVKSSVPFLAEAVGGIALTTPNLDELAAMSFTASNSSRRGSGAQPGGYPLHASTLGHGETEGGVTAGHLLGQAAIANGELVDARPLGDSLKNVLSAMLVADVPRASGGAVGCSTATSSSSMPLLDGARHVAVTMGSAGVLLASARPGCTQHPGNDDSSTIGCGGNMIESPPGSGRWFALSAEHYPALPLGPREGYAVADCTGAGDCLVAGMVGGLALGWSTRESVCLGLLCARHSVMADKAVPESLGELLGGVDDVHSVGGKRILSRLLQDYEPKTVRPWGT